jgi:diacylglycerol kinase family enzyme
VRTARRDDEPAGLTVPGFGVVVNPHAGGRGRGTRYTQRLAREVAGDGWVYETATVAELDDVVREFHRRRIDVLVICGGDGSLFPCLSACIRRYGNDPLPPLLPLRSGTVNTIAGAVGAPAGGPMRVLSRALRRYRRAEALRFRERQLLLVNGKHYGFMTGAGTIVSFLQAYYSGPLQGSLGAAHLILRLIASGLNGRRRAEELFRWLDARVTCDGKPVPFEQFSAIYAATIKEIGLGFRPTYRAGEQCGTFHFLAGPLTVKETTRCLPRIRRGVATGSALLFDELARSVVIELRDPSPYMVDGDVLEPVSRMTIEAGPALRVVIEAEEP